MIVLTAGVLVAGCSSTSSSQSSPCPGQSAGFSIRVDVAAVTPGTVLRLCANQPGCVERHVTRSNHPHYVFIGYSYTGTAGTADIRLTLRASRDGRAHQSAVVLPIKQSQFGRCGDYGGTGYARVTTEVRGLPVGPWARRVRRMSLRR
jgi:hypothetical protein